MNICSFISQKRLPIFKTHDVESIHTPTGFRSDPIASSKKKWRGSLGFDAITGAFRE